MTKEVSTTPPKFIILEGVDRSGKGSMQNAIDKATKYKHFVMDRGPIGFMTYCVLFNKPKDLYTEYQHMENVFSQIPNILMIYLTASTEELIDRCIRTNHEILDFDLHKKVYESYVKASKIPSITIDTTEKHVDEIVQDLIKEGIL